MGTEASFQADQARRQRSNESCQLGAWHAGTKQHWLACFIDTMNGKDLLCQIDSNRYDCHDFPSRTS
jgi:hypothetical protein